MDRDRNSSDPHALDRETLIVAAVVLLGAAMSGLDMTAVNVAIGDIAADFNASFTSIQWVVTGYTLALAAVVPLTGWAADRFGTKRIYIWALAGFVSGSILCAFSWSAESLIAFRVLQGLGGGMILPLVMTIVARKAGVHRRGRVMGLLGVPLLTAPVLGPILGGWLVDDLSWRWIFLINLPIGIVAITLAKLVLDRDEPQPTHRLDWLGMALLSPGLSLMIFGLAKSPENGFAAPESWLPIVAGGGLIAVFLWHSWRATAPLIDIKTLVHTRAGAALGTMTLMSCAMFGALLMVPLYFQVVRGASALESGLLLAPQGIGAMVTMPIAGWAIDRHGPYRLSLYGLPLLVIGSIPFVFVSPTTPYLLLCGANFVLGLGMGIAFMPASTAAMQSVPPAALARTSSALNIADQSGAALGAAILSVVLASAISAQLPDVNGIAALDGLSDAGRAAVAGPLAASFSTAFLWALGLIILAVVPALALALAKPETSSAPEPGPASPQPGGGRPTWPGRRQLAPGHHQPVGRPGEIRRCDRDSRRPPAAP